MTYAELDAIFDGRNPVMFPGVRMGLLIRLRPEAPECGIQIPFEEDIRWMSSGDFVHAGGGSLLSAARLEATEPAA